MVVISNYFFFPSPYSVSLLLGLYLQSVRQEHPGEVDGEQD